MNPGFKWVDQTVMRTEKNTKLYLMKNKTNFFAVIF